MKFLKVIALLLIVLILIYLVGPKPETPKFNNNLPELPSVALDLETLIWKKETEVLLKPDNYARIIWNDSTKSITEYSIVYLHGFTASQEEGDPVHVQFARKFGCNLFLSRLDEHGVVSMDPMLHLTAEKLWESAKRAFAIGKKIGKKVILVGTSTGGTLALKLAAEFPEVAGLILLSPNIEINDGAAWALNNPWGLQLARMVRGKYIYAKDTTTQYKKYWHHKYRAEAVVQLQELLETTMKETTFRKITQPLLLLYYYKDEDNQDGVVKVSAMKRMFEQVQTPAHLKQSVAVPGAGDHVIGSYIKSKDLITVASHMEQFGKRIWFQN